MIENLNLIKKFNLNKQFAIALNKIYGISQSTGILLCRLYSMHDNILFKDIGKKKLLKINEFINENLVIGNSLGSFLKKQKEKHINSGTYKGIRYQTYLPVRGQRTHSNASLGKPFRVIKKDKKKLSRRELAQKYKKRAQFFPKV